MLIVQLLITAILLGMNGILFLNWWTFPRLRRIANGKLPPAYLQPCKPATCNLPSPRLSFLVPARNEAAVIGGTVRSLLGQGGDEIEVLILDDHSIDGTGEIARAAAEGDPRLRVLAGVDLPPGWLGKNWACHQLGEAARGEILVFTDADVRWGSGALAALLAEMERAHADLLTIWPTQETVTWGERLTVPLMALVVHAYLPILFVHHYAHPLFGAANGQCMVFRRAAYDRIGGHAAVRDNVVEDVSLARRIKVHGLRLRMAEGNHLITCRMYRSWDQARDGFAKSILKGYGNAAGLIASTFFHWLVFLGPWMLLILGALGVDLPGWPLWPLALALGGIGLRALTAIHSQQRVGDALLFPLSVLLMTRIAAQALWWQVRYGGPLWKGRVVKK